MLSKLISALQRQFRFGNVLIHNLLDDDESNKELFSPVLNILTNADLSLNETNIDTIYRLGKMQGNRSIIVRLNSGRWKQEVLKKHAAFKESNLSVTLDRSQE